MDDIGKKIIFGKYEMGKVLGQGSFGKVYHCRKLDSTNESVAIKVINKERLNLKTKMDQQIEREIRVMRLIRHPNVVELKEVMATKAKIFFVMEYVKGGELFAKVLRGRLKEEHARKYFQQLISAVDYCHSRGVSHRDLKPENLLVDENGNLKVSDFGLSAYLPEQQRHDGLLHTQCGTPAYVAPEVLRKKGYSGEKADLWSCGVVLFVLLAGYLPFQDENVMNMYRKVFKAEYQFPPWFPNDARRLVSKLLVVDPEKRLSVEGIKRAPWFYKGFTTTTTIPFHSHSGKTPPPLPQPQELPQKEEVQQEEEEEEEEALTSEMKMKKKKKKLTKSRSGFYNAFELISSLSSGFDLSGLFITDNNNNNDDQNRSRRRSTSSSSSSLFTSRLPARGVRTKIESAAKKLNFSILDNSDNNNNNNNNNEYSGSCLIMESKVDGRKGKLGLVADVFEVAPQLAVVELSKSSGDTFEYYDFCDQHLRPALKDIVWTWPGQPTN